MAFAGTVSAEVKEYNDYYYEDDFYDYKDYSYDDYTNNYNGDTDTYSYEEYGNGTYEVPDTKDFLFDISIGGSYTWFAVPRVYADTSLSCNFSDEFGFGCGFKAYMTDGDSFEADAEYFIPYALYRARLGNLKLNLKAGALITYETVKKGVAVSPYFDASCGIPVLDFPRGQFGFELGFEYLVIPYDMLVSKKSDDFGSDDLVARAFNNLQVYGGIKYFLPF